VDNDGSSVGTGDGSGTYNDEINFKMVIIKELRCKIRQNLSEKTAIASNIGYECENNNISY
jgi:hypothetical protein